MRTSALFRSRVLWNSVTCSRESPLASCWCATSARHAATTAASTCVTPPDKGPLPDKYDAQFVEKEWYDWWERIGVFKPRHDNDQQEPFVMMLPPPNVTGRLHLGHALTCSIEDSVVRWHRMQGRPTLWVPGTDHAGIATQTVVEKHLMRTQGKTRHDLGRAAFVESVWEWREQYGTAITDQLRALGSSLDWSRQVFTMDEKFSRAVTEAFVRLYEQGRVSRAERPVNWSPALRSAISDIEVEKLSIEEPTKLFVPGHSEPQEFGYIYEVAYTGVDEDIRLVAATTRPETIAADVALAVHPEDARYRSLVGKRVKNPLTGQPMPIVADEDVDAEFGTGVVKITPAHDVTDYNIGVRHGLPSIRVIDESGRLCGPVPEHLRGMPRFEARTPTWHMLQNHGSAVEKRQHAMVLPLCSRSGDIVEPLVKHQWFVDCTDMAQSALQAVSSGQLKISPSVFNTTWQRWLEAIQPWCVSRQLWWGHRIPAYRVINASDRVDEHSVSRNSSSDGFWVVARNEDEARQQAASLLGRTDTDKIQLEQDDDVLDTWFSSGIYPFAAFGWPNGLDNGLETMDLQRYFPTTMLETGQDILFFWVARMVMLSSALTDKRPFREVQLHPMVRDAQGRKMSKSLGNVIDPNDIIHGISLELMQQRVADSNLSTKEIEMAKRDLQRAYPNGLPASGTDALRLTLCGYASQGININLDPKRVESAAAFCNKIWQAFRYVRLKQTEGDQPLRIQDLRLDNMSQVHCAHAWILSRLATTANQVRMNMETCNLGAAVRDLSSFWVNDFCDLYLELTKQLMLDPNADDARYSRAILLYCVDAGLRLLHPIMPFLTEELYQRLPSRQHEGTVCLAPAYDGWVDKLSNVELEQNMAQLRRLTTALRSCILLRNHRGPRSEAPSVHLVCDSLELRTWLQNAAPDIIRATTIASDVTISSSQQVPTTSIAAPSHWDAVDLRVEMKRTPSADEVSQELAKLAKQKVKLERGLEKIQKRVTSPKYAIAVDDTIKAEDQAKIAQIRAQIEDGEEALEVMRALSSTISQHGD